MQERGFMEAGEALKACLQRLIIHIIGFQPDALHVKRVLFLVPARFAATDEALTLQNWQDVIAILALRRNGVNLPAVVEIKEETDQLAVPEQVIQRSDQRGMRLRINTVQDSFKQRKIRLLQKKVFFCILDADLKNFSGFCQRLKGFVAFRGF